MLLAFVVIIFHFCQTEFVSIDVAMFDLLHDAETVTGCNIG